MLFGFWFGLMGGRVGLAFWILVWINGREGWPCFLDFGLDLRGEDWPYFLDFSLDWFGFERGRVGLALMTKFHSKIEFFSPILRKIWGHISHKRMNSLDSH